MQWQNRISTRLALVFLVFGLCGFRTPAKLYAGAYSVKIQVKKDFTEYDIPVWIKPDQAESSFDPILMKELGYVDKVFEFQDVKISGVSIEQKKFKSMKSEWAFVPDFAKSCCHGVIGRDILEKYELRFDPKAPTHIEWKRLETQVEKATYAPAFLNSLKGIFSLEKFNSSPFVLNLQERKLDFEEKPVPSKSSLFSFFFIPPDRMLKVTGVLPAYEATAKKAGLTPGAVVVSLNGESVGGMDRWLIERYLRGEKGDSLKLTLQTKKEMVFDFNSRQFK